MSIAVIRYIRNKIWSDKKSPLLHYLKLAPGQSKVFNIEKLARNIEVAGSLNTKEVVYTMRIVVDEIRKVLVEGNKVKIDDLGLFHLTFSSDGSAAEKDCTVKSIRRIHIRFTPDETLRLYNDSTTPATRGTDKNVKFHLVSAVNAGGGDTPEPEPGDEEEDPTA